MGNKWETSVNSCGTRHPEWETRGGQGEDKGETRGRQGGDKGETSVNSCDPKNPEWETSVGDKCGTQV